MVYTITFNPSLDYVIQVDEFNLNSINRSSNENFFVGGKGINVSRVLNSLGVKSIPLGFIGGFTGDEIVRLLSKEGIESSFTKIRNGETRINVKVSNMGDTAINASGPIIDDLDVMNLFNELKKINSNDIVVLAGSIPRGVNRNIYSFLCEYFKNNNIKFIVDATRDLLVSTLKYNPFLIKPNLEELEETLGIKIKNAAEVYEACFKLQRMGAINVLVSLGKDGAILVDSNHRCHKLSAVKIDVINTVGAGDSMIAGFIYGYLETNDYHEALKYGISSGSATASLIDLADKDTVLKFYNLIKD